MDRLLVTSIAAALLAASAPRAAAQCTTVWVPGSGPPVPSAVYSTTMWDPPGAAPAVLVVGGFVSPGFGLPRVGVVGMQDLVTGVWTVLGSWIGEEITALAAGPNGELFAVAFLPGAIWDILRWNGAGWTSLGIADGQVMALRVAANGDLFAGGGFSQIGSVPLASVARWSGGAWSAVGSGPNGYVDELVWLPNGNLVAGGSMGVAQWNGQLWTPIPGFFGWGLALAVAANGDLLAGTFMGGPGVMRWNGTSWTTLGVLPNGPIVEAVLELPDGDVLAGGNLVSVAWTGNALLRWNGTSWSPAAPAVSAATWMLRTLTPLPDGDVLVSGVGWSMPNAPAGLARLTTTCPASVTPAGTGCPSSGGGNVLVAPPAWTGATWTASASGLPAQAFAVAVTGLTTTSVPLPALLPQGVAGCTLYVAPDVLVLAAASAGTATSSFSIPASPALTGGVFFHQVVALELAAPLQIVAATATNALRLVIGTF